MEPLFQKISVSVGIRAIDLFEFTTTYHCKYSHIMLTHSLYLSVSLSVVSQVTDYKLSGARNLLSLIM